LENWEGPNPFRKDFNWREYVRNKFYDKKNEREKVYYD
jgi:NADH:ubiquinone oxidoreductase subunit C